jgi:nucleotide-binding universal stress UspA family protein
MIIIGTHGSKGIEKLLLGSVAERVVKNAHCPTLVMNPFKQ